MDCFRAASCLLVISMLWGCRQTQPAPKRVFQDAAHTVQQAAYFPEHSVAALAPVIDELAGPQPVEQYIQFALRQNPEIQAARMEMEARAYQVPVAASLQDPMFGVNAFPEPIQTAAGQQELAVMASQRLPWFGKLDRQAARAEAATNVARARLATAELQTIESVKVAYYELYYLQRAVRITEDEQELLTDIRQVANTRYQTGQTSQQDVLRADLEIAGVESELIRLRQQLVSTQARLARILHVSPQTNLLAVESLPNERLPDDLTQLQQLAATARPELHAQLAAIERDRQSVAIAQLDYFPDLTLGATWNDIASAGISPVANGRDAFMINTSINLPIYRKRLDASVRSAQSQVVASARQYDSLRDMTLEEVTNLFVTAQSQQDLLALFRETIVPTARQTLEVSVRGYNVGEVDFLQLIDNWRQVLRYEIMYGRLEASLHQTLAQLERVVGGLPSSPGEAELASLEETRVPQP